MSAPGRPKHELLPRGGTARSARGVPKSAATRALATELGRLLEAHGLKVATAESCTGGLVGAAITDIAGSSGWFDRGFVTYSNEAKIELLGVRAETIRAYGAVSEATAREMAVGALANSAADLAVAITGVAGPTGGTPEKPVGMVCLAWAQRGAAVNALTVHFDGNRRAVRHAAVAAALEGLVTRAWATG